MYNCIPSQCFPALLIKEMVTACIFWLNMFPPHDGMSDILSSLALMTGFNLDYRIHSHLEFSSYVQMHKEHDNLIHSRTTSVITLCPTRNHPEGHYFMSLMMGWKLT